MANSKLNDGENILVKVDVNNLVFVDPNSVQNGDKVEPRGFKQENLVMFVNLEADLVPRSILTSSGDLAYSNSFAFPPSSTNSCLAVSNSAVHNF